MSKHVAVLLGGTSAERAVSLSSGKACADALEGEGYQVTRVDVGPDIASVLAALRPDVAFNALHGPDGEDGTIQGLLEILKIPYTHSGVLASALAMNKARAKTVMRAAGVEVPEGLIVNRFEAAKNHPPAATLRGEAHRGGVLRRCDHRARRPRAPAPVPGLGGVAVRRASPCGTLHSRPRADLRGDGRQAARRHRGEGRDGGLVRLRREVCPGGLGPRAAG